MSDIIRSRKMPAIVVFAAMAVIGIAFVMGISHLTASRHHMSGHHGTSYYGHHGNHH
jgi:hypothetical protein